ncbi:MAG: peptidase domain-containing protein [Methanoregula sp.]|nr:peptidase domain-containing protein [Methanoregula sp.]
MKVSVTTLAILVCAIVLISGVSAQDVDKSAGYSASPAGNLHLPAVMSPMTAGSITQGETDWYSVSVLSGTSSITADLTWGYVPDSLSLTVIAPDGTLGPYYDTSDGVSDGRIFLTFGRTGGITPGTWRFKVYGETVLGTQGYNFVTY